MTRLEAMKECSKIINPMSDEDLKYWCNVFFLPSSGTLDQSSSGSLELFTDSYTSKNALSGMDRAECIDDSL